MIMKWVNSSNSDDTLELVVNAAPTVTCIEHKFWAGTDAVEADDNSMGDITIIRTNCKFVQQDDIYAVLDDPEFNKTNGYPIHNTKLS